MSIYVNATVSGASKITAFYHDPAKFENGQGRAHLTVFTSEDGSNVQLGAESPAELLAFAHRLHAKATELAEQAGVVHTSTVADPELAAALLWRDSR